MTYGTDLGAILPNVGDTTNWPGPAYATRVKACIQACIDRLETKVTAAGIDLQEDLELNGYLVTELGGATFEDLDAVLDASAYPCTVFFKDGDFYVNDGAGQQVRIITGGALDVSSTGAISGAGYGSSGVEVAWDSSGELYRFKDGADTTDFASIEVETARLASGTTGFFAALAAGAAMAADKTFTLPAAFPASTSVMTMDSAGAIANSRALTIDTLTITGLLTATGGVTCAADAHVTVSGTGRYKRGAMTRWRMASVGQQTDGTGGVWNLNGTWSNGGVGDNFQIDFELEEGEQITAWSARVDPASSGTVTGQLKRRNVAAGTTTTIGSTSVSSGASRQAIGVSSLTETATSDRAYFVEFTFATATGHEVEAASLTTNVP